MTRTAALVTQALPLLGRVADRPGEVRTHTEPINIGNTMNDLSRACVSERAGVGVRRITDIPNPTITMYVSQR